MLATLLLGSRLAAAAGVTGYAVLVGSNRAGPGQEPLRYAVDDAERVRDVLAELGAWELDQVELLADPDPERLLGVLDEVGRRLDEHRASGEPTVFVFYYSGHARARGLDLGQRELPLDRLQERLDTLDASVSLVVLDACQAGALSQVKGAAPTADFSFNAATGLTTEGRVVMASSSAAELSQESPALGGSFFTHHLVTGLRGAADVDADGAVTLGEAYGYAYHRTLVSTAATAVGSQHVTLETDLRGKGDMVLTRPGEASSRLLLPADLEAELLVHRTRPEVVVAEVVKVPGAPLGLALVPGDYRVVARARGELFACALALGEGDSATLRLAQCEVLDTAETVAKGGARLERWMLELGLGASYSADDAYTDRLADFGYGESLQIFGGATPVFYGAAAWSHDRHLGLVVAVSDLESAAWSRSSQVIGSDEETSQHFEWVTWRASLSGRAGWPLLGGWVVPYAQAGAGPALAVTDFTDEQVQDRQLQWGVHLAAAGGLQLMPAFGGTWRHLGAFAQVEGTWAPVLHNLVGDRHDSGGLNVVAGLRGGF